MAIVSKKKSVHVTVYKKDLVKLEELLYRLSKRYQNFREDLNEAPLTSILFQLCQSYQLDIKDFKEEDTPDKAEETVKIPIQPLIKDYIESAFSSCKVLKTEDGIHLLLKAFDKTKDLRIFRSTFRYVTM